MFSIPLNEKTFPYGLLKAVGGEVSLGTAGGVVQRLLEANEPFDPQASRGENNLIAVGFNLPGEQAVPIGTAGKAGFRAALDVKAVLDLVWPDEDQTLLEAYGLRLEEEERFYVVFQGSGAADLGADVSGRVPQGGLTGSLGLRSGASLEYVYLKPYERSRKAVDILLDFFKGMRLPSQVTRAAEIPGEGEVVALAFSGYLKVKSALSWGYAVSKSASMEPGGLDLEGSVEVDSGLSLGLDYQMAGNWSVEVRKGAKDGWARVVVRKRKQSGLQFAADLSVGAEIGTEGLPEDADQFLEAALGMRTPEVLGQVEAVVQAGPEAFVAALKEKADGITQEMVRALFKRWWPEETFDFDNPSGWLKERAPRVYGRLQQAVAAYGQLKELDGRIVDLLELYRGHEKELKAVVVKVSEFSSREELEAEDDEKVLGFLRRYLGDRLLDVLTDDDVFEEVKERLEAVARLDWSQVLDLVGVRGAALKVEDLVAQLKGIGSGEALKKKSEAYLMEFAGRMTGKAFDTLKGETLERAFRELQEMLGRLEGFKKELYGRFQEALNGSCKMELSWAYARASERDSLVDVEVNLEHENGPGLMQEALAGDFSRLMTEGTDDCVRVRPSRFTSETKQSSRLRLNLLGWKRESFREMVLRTGEVVTQQGNGLLHVYTLSAEETVQRTRRDEEVQMNFLFELMARGAHAFGERPDLIDSISRMSSDYALRIGDRDTSETELREYLRLAEYLEMVPAGGLDACLARFRAELGIADPGHWGPVEMKYRVRYEPSALLSIFLLRTPSIQAAARQAYRRILSTHFLQFGTQYRALAQMILDDRIYFTWKTDQAKLSSREAYEYAVALPSGETVKVSVDQFRRRVLKSLYDLEDRFVEALLKLDSVMDRARAGQAKPNRKEMTEAFNVFVQMRGELEKWMTLQEADRYVNPFFAILDHLIAVISGARGRKSALEMRFQSQGGEEVTKILVA